MSVGPFQLLVIALVLLLLFGRGRVSDSLGDLGKGVRVFRKGLQDPDQPEPLTIEGQLPDTSIVPVHANQADK